MSPDIVAPTPRTTVSARMTEPSNLPSIRRDPEVSRSPVMTTCESRSEYPFDDAFEGAAVAAAEARWRREKMRICSTARGETPSGEDQSAPFNIQDDSWGR